MINKKLFQVCLSASLGLLAGVHAAAPVVQNNQPVAQAPVLNNQIYSLAQTLTGTVPGTANFGANFGSAVALNGDYLFVAAANAAPNGIANAGVLNIYKKDQNGDYQPSQEITSLLGADDLLGSIGSIQSDGEWLFVSIGGSPDGEGAQARAGGLVQVYQLKTVNKAKTWVPVQQLQPADLSIGDNFGGARFSLDASAGWAFISAPNQTQLNEGEEAPGGGAVYVFKYNPDAKQWFQYQKLVKPDGYHAANTHFGTSTAVKGFYALVGSDNNNTAGNNGSAYAYIYVSGQWVCSQILTGEKPALLDPVAQGDGFGTSVSIDGKWAVVSAPLDSTQGVANHGKVYFFRGKAKKGAKYWTLSSATTSDVANPAGYLGAKVLVKGNKVFASTLNRSDADNRVYGGGVILFQLDGDAWTQAQVFGSDAAYSFAGADFAYSNSRDTVAVGSFANLDYYLPLQFARKFTATGVSAGNFGVKLFKPAASE